MRNHKRLAAGAACVLAAVLAAAALFAASGRKPFQGLEAAEIAFATVHLSPPDRTLQIPEPGELAAYLREIVTYQKDDSYKEYDGQGVTFTLAMEDGTRIQIMAYNPFVVIDGVGYKTKYEPCAALASYANRLLDEEEAQTILEEPPALTVVCGDTSIGTLKSNYGWTTDHNDTVLACGTHPLDSRDLMLQFGTVYETMLPTVTLNFTEDPSAFRVRCWSDAHWSDPAAESEETAVEGYELELKPGGYIYAVEAEWDVVNGYGGSVEYSFFVVRQTSREDRA